MDKDMFHMVQCHVAIVVVHYKFNFINKRDGKEGGFVMAWKQGFYALKTVLILLIKGIVFYLSVIVTPCCCSHSETKKPEIDDDDDDTNYECLGNNNNEFLLLLTILDSSEDQRIE